MPNLFALAFASDSEDESAPVQQKKQAPTAKKPAATPVELAKSRNPDTTKKTQPQDKANEKAKEPQAVQKEKRPPRTNQNRPNRPRNTENDFSAATGTKEEDHQRSSDRGRGRGRGKDRGGAPGQRRVFDRHSGTGRDRGMKKDGAGAHNWGDTVTMTEEAKKEVIADTEKEIEPTESKEANESKPTEQIAEGETKQEEPAEPVEPAKPQFTLEEYMAKKQEKRTGLGFEEKQEVEVEDLKEGRAYAKQDVEDGAAKRKAKKSGKEKTSANMSLEVGFKVKQNEGNTDSYRGRGRGRGRGAFRGGPRREGFRGRGGHGHSSGVDVSETNFPELGA